MLRFLPLLFLSCGLVAQEVTPPAPSQAAIDTARYAESKYRQAMIDSLAAMVRFETTAKEGLPLAQDPAFTGFRAYLKNQAATLGLDFKDYGGVLVIGLGQGQKKLGVVTHGDVQPADPAKWRQNPFTLDTTSEPGRLVARGTEDDKGPIATALYAMKAIKDKGLTPKRRIELIVSLTEESDWDPFRAFLKQHPVPDLNITIDADYPVVVAEKGWCSITTEFHQDTRVTDGSAQLLEFSGGAFVSQIPEDATALVRNLSERQLGDIKARAARYPAMEFTFGQQQGDWRITARGRAAHSSNPENGINALTHLADVLNIGQWPATRAGATVNFINDLLGTQLYGERFGDIAYRDDFMGPMSVSLTLITPKAGHNELKINLRRPVGKTKEQLSKEIHAALNEWQQRRDYPLANTELYIGTPHQVGDAPHVAPLLGLFSHFTGIEDPRPVSISGSTNAKLLPNAVSFGPSMPGVPYTGHSEHEFITVEQLALNLRLYTAMMLELGNLD